MGKAESRKRGAKRKAKTNETPERGVASSLWVETSLSVSTRAEACRQEVRGASLGVLANVEGDARSPGGRGANVISRRGTRHLPASSDAVWGPTHPTDGG